MRGSKYTFPLLAAAILASVGCSRGPEFANVEGTVKLNGKPLEKIHIEFWPEADGGSKSFAVTDEQGHYVLTTIDGERDGAQVGMHRILLRDAARLGDRFLGRKAEGVDMSNGRKSRIPDKYTGIVSSPLKKEVQSGNNTIDLEVTP